MVTGASIGDFEDQGLTKHPKVGILNSMSKITCSDIVAIVRL
jgi:hypothetical protein